jgi:hypothetical protein
MQSPVIRPTAAAENGPRSIFADAKKGDPMTEWGPLTPLEDFMEELGITQADLDALPDEEQALSEVDDLSNLISLRIFDCADTDTCSVLMKHYGVSDIVILETATELAKTILGKYSITPKPPQDVP